MLTRRQNQSFTTLYPANIHVCSLRNNWQKHPRMFPGIVPFCALAEIYQSFPCYTWSNFADIFVIGCHNNCRSSHHHDSIWFQWFYSKTRDDLPVWHDDVIKWKHFPRNWPFVRRIHRSPVNSPHKGQRRRALMFPLICVWINDWVNNREAGDLRRHLDHYDVSVMALCIFMMTIGRNDWKCETI